MLDESPNNESQDWTLISRWADAKSTAVWLDQLKNCVVWQQPVLQVYGRKYPVPRLTSFLAEVGVRYRYSGTEHVGSGWPEWFLPLLKKVNETSSCTFNGCLLNFYRNGEDAMGWHADDEREIDKTAPIASLSIGAGRDFLMRKKKKVNEERVKSVVLNLSDGDLLIMHPGCQEKWQHSIPRRKRIKQIRINLTFRKFSIISQTKNDTMKSTFSKTTKASPKDIAKKKILR